MTFRRRGPVTKENSIFNYKEGYVACPISTNKWTDDEYFTIDILEFPKAEGRFFCVVNDSSHDSNTHYVLHTRKKKGDYINKGSMTCLHWLLFYDDSIAKGLTTDHLLHWTDNRSGSVQFISMAENASFGAALFHKGHKNRIQRKEAV